MRRIFLPFLLICAMSANAQTYLPGSLSNNLIYPTLTNQSFLSDTTPGKKWFVSRYTGISTSVIFSNGGSATVLSVPIGIQLNRKLNNNLYAFGGVSVAPAYINFNRSFLSANMHKTGQQNGFMKSNQLNLFSRAEMGLMYVNDAKTFSISGSIGIERGSYPLFYPNSINTVRPGTLVTPNRP